MTLTKNQLVSRSWKPKHDGTNSKLSRDKLDSQIVDFLDNGGRIKEIPSSVTPHTRFKAGGSGGFRVRNKA